MSVTPWLGPALLTLAGTMVGALATLSLGLLNRRSERRRLSRAEKVAAYPEFAGVSYRLAELPVWPDESSPGEAGREVERLAQRIAFFGSARVAATLGPVVVAARGLVAVVERIRAETQPGHRDQVDLRVAARHAAAVAELRQAIGDFADAGRADLEIRGRYTPMITSGDASGTLGDGQPGAGSREPGAGSREPGAGSREPLSSAVRLCHAA